MLVRKVVIIGSGPAAHTAAIYTSRARLQPLVFEGFMANGIAAGGQLTTTTEVENFPGHVSISGPDLTALLREQSTHSGAEVITETVDRVDLSSRPFRVFYGPKEVLADTLIIATGAVARRLDIPGAGEGPDGFWNRGVSACAVCDGAAPIFRDAPLFVIGGGDSAMEEAMFLSRYGSSVTVVHRRDTLRASMAMQERARANPKVKFLFDSAVVRCEGGGGPRGNSLGGVVVKSLLTGEETKHPAAGLFFAVGHDPATAFLEGQLTLDEDGYIAVQPGTTKTSVEGVFAAGDVADKRYRQAVTAAGTGCMSAIDAEHFLSEHGEG